jgi:hypothetical protein
MMDKAYAEAKSGKQPTMPTMADVEALTRESEWICHDPRNQNKPA